jgi:carboxypeptidase family protein/TonB-dependent receptor-like protein
MKPNAITVAVAVWVVTLCLSLAMNAQVAGATLSGTITDTSGAVIPGAQISVKNLATSLTSSTTTNADGFYSVPNLLPASYQVTFAAKGFGTKATTVTLTVGAKQELSLVLAVGKMAETVEVSDLAPSIQLSTSTLSGNVAGQEVRELPLNGRDWGSLATLEPGVAQVRTQEAVTQVGSHARGLGMQMTIDGNRPQQNTYRLNGIIINDYSNAGPGSVLGQNLGVDAIQEFSVLTNNYSAEYGFTSGGVINAITRSGTSQFHGSAYEFLRNSKLDAADYFENHNDLPKAPFRRNQFGGSAGGPIWKDKVFIFGDYEGLRQSKGITHVAHVPSLAARAGNIHDDNGNPITVPVDANIAKFFTFYHAPNAGLIGLGDTGNYAFSGAQVVPENYFTTRGDVKISDKDSLNSSYYYDRSTFTQPDGLNQVKDQFAVGRQGGALEETHIFSPGMVNSIRLGYNRSYGDGQLTVAAINPAAADQSFGMIPGLYAPRIITPGLTTFTGGLRGQSVQNYLLQTYQVYDDALRTFGKHNLKFGGMLVRLHEDLYAPFIEDGTASFPSLAAFLQNQPSRASGPPNVASISTHYNRDWIIGGYVQDDWHMRPDLTLNLGLRYEMATIPTEINGRIANLPTIETDPGTGVFNRSYFPRNVTTKNFEPRIGFSWDPFHNGKTAIRGGFGLFDALPLPYELVINNAQTSPFHVVVVNNSNLPQGSFPHGISLPTNPPAAGQAWNYVDTNIKRNYVYQWNFNIQRQLPGNTAVTLAYAGSHAVHNPFQLDDINTVFPYNIQGRWVFPNPICSGPTPAASCLTQGGSTIVPGHPINTNVAALQTTLWTGMSYYNSLQARVAKQMTHGLQAEASFTWSKTMDTSSGSFAGDNFSSDVTPTTPWWDLRVVRGLSDFNIGRNLVVNLLYELPVAKSFGGPAAWVIKGWQLGAILQASDGVPIWPLDGLEGDPMGQLNSEPLAIPDILPTPDCRSLVNPGNPDQYIKAGCFTVAQAPSLDFYNTYCDKSHAFPRCDNLLGTLRRNSIIGPGLVNLDYSMVKNNYIPRISENFNIQFRAEFFNVLNHPSFAPPVNNLEAIDATGAPVQGFGQITNLQVPSREIQFALKVIW